MYMGTLTVMVPSSIYSNTGHKATSLAKITLSKHVKHGDNTNLQKVLADKKERKGRGAPCTTPDEEEPTKLTKRRLMENGKKKISRFPDSSRVRLQGTLMKTHLFTPLLQQPWILVTTRMQRAE